jgi:hypothetical protein
MCALQVKSSRVLAVGAGGIGCELLKTLVLSGFQTIEVVRARETKRPMFEAATADVQPCTLQLQHVACRFFVYSLQLVVWIDLQTLPVSAITGQLAACRLHQ